MRFSQSPVSPAAHPPGFWFSEVFLKPDQKQRRRGIGGKVTFSRLAQLIQTFRVSNGLLLKPFLGASAQLRSKENVQILGFERDGQKRRFDSSHGSALGFAEDKAEYRLFRLHVGLFFSAVRLFIKCSGFDLCTQMKSQEFGRCTTFMEFQPSAGSPFFLSC
jgi:hypothetical protein